MLPYFAVIVVATHAVAFASWHLIEKPAMSLKDWSPTAARSRRPAQTVGAGRHRDLGAGAACSAHARRAPPAPDRPPARRSPVPLSDRHRQRRRRDRAAPAAGQPAAAAAAGRAVPVVPAPPSSVSSTAAPVTIGAPASALAAGTRRSQGREGGGARPRPGAPPRSTPASTASRGTARRASEREDLQGAHQEGEARLRQGQGRLEVLHRLPGSRTSPRRSAGSPRRPKQREAWATWIAKQQKIVEKAGGRYHVVVAPANWDVYPQKLPTWAQKLRGTTSLRQADGATTPSCPWIDTRAALRKAAKKHDTYEPLDSHWTPYGGYVAWQAITKCLRATDHGAQRRSTRRAITGVGITANSNEFAPNGVPDGKPRRTYPIYAAPHPGDHDHAPARRRADRRPVPTSSTDTLQAPLKTSTPGAQRPRSRCSTLRDSTGNALSPLWSTSFGTTVQYGHGIDQPAHASRPEPRAADGRPTTPTWCCSSSPSASWPNPPKSRGVSWCDLPGHRRRRLHRLRPVRRSWPTTSTGSSPSTTCTRRCTRSRAPRGARPAGRAGRGRRHLGRRLGRAARRRAARRRGLHLAAETGTAQSLTEATRHAQVNVVGTTEMLDALVRHDAAARAGGAHLVARGLRRGRLGGRRRRGCTYPGQRSAAMLEAGQWDFPGLTPTPFESARVRPTPTSVYGSTKLAQEHVLDLVVPRAGRHARCSSGCRTSTARASP